MSLHWRNKSSHTDVAVHLHVLSSIHPSYHLSATHPHPSIHHSGYPSLHLPISPPNRPSFVHPPSVIQPSFIFLPIRPFSYPLMRSPILLSPFDYPAHLLIFFPPSSILPVIIPSINELICNMKQEVHGIEPIWYLRSRQNDDSIESKQDQKWLQKVE